MLVLQNKLLLLNSEMEFLGAWHFQIVFLKVEKMGSPIEIFKQGSWCQRVILCRFLSKFCFCFSNYYKYNIEGLFSYLKLYYQAKFQPRVLLHLNIPYDHRHIFLEVIFQRVSSSLFLLDNNYKLASKLSRRITTKIPICAFDFEEKNWVAVENEKVATLQLYSVLQKNQKLN